MTVSSACSLALAGEDWCVANDLSYRRAGADAEPFIEVEPVPVTPEVDELPEFIVPLDCTPVVPIVVSADPGATIAPAPTAPVTPGNGVDIPPVVLMLPVLFTGGRTIGAPPAGRSVRLMSGFAGLAGYGVWANAEPASVSTADETSKTKDLFKMFSVCCNEGHCRESRCQFLCANAHTLPRNRERVSGKNLYEPEGCTSISTRLTTTRSVAIR